MSSASGNSFVSPRVSMFPKTKKSNGEKRQLACNLRRAIFVRKLHNYGCTARNIFEFQIKDRVVRVIKIGEKIRFETFATLKTNIMWQFLITANDEIK